jgi:hypothetical protein
MSRARPIGNLWFDRKRSHEKATSEQFETLAAAENIPIDDLLDEGLSQGDVIVRLRIALGEGVIPAEVLERKRQRRLEAQRQPDCRICTGMGWECEGSITRHHFIPRWMMLQLENYTAYAARVRCTIPVCVSRHRDLHIPNDQETPKSIVQFLNERERLFAQKMLGELREQHPAIFNLLLAGDETRYEAVLVLDYVNGRFAAMERAGFAALDSEREGSLAIG